MLVSTRMLRHHIALPWVATLCLQATLAAVLLLKRMWLKFRVFMIYALANLVLGVACYITFQLGSPFAYFVIYWITEATSLFLGLAVVCEIFIHLFRPYPGLRKLAATVFRCAVVFLLVLGVIVIYKQPVGEHYPVGAGLLSMEQAARILETGLLLFLFLFASAFGLHWRQYVFGIALGLGIFVTVELVAITMRVQFGIAANSIFNIVRTVSYNSSLFIWIAYILAPELATQPCEMPKRAQLEQWNKAVMELIYQ